jgi:hypothetical protein
MLSLGHVFSLMTCLLIWSPNVVVFHMQLIMCFKCHYIYISIYIYICLNMVQIDILTIILTCTLNSPNSVHVTIFL